ncbi:MAG TPA: glycosyltransferase [Opitutaceae bacterium]
MTVPDVTILTVTHNTGRYLPACVASVQAQAGVTWEHLVADNGSTDNTTSFLESVRAADSRLRVVRFPENLGYGEAMRRSRAEVRGRFIAFLDADDLMRPDRLARQTRWLVSNPEFNSVFADAEPIDAEGNSLGARVFAAGTEAALRKFSEFSMPACHSTGMVRAEDYHLVTAEAYLRQAPDFDIVCRLLDHGRVGFLPEIVGSYRRHSSQVSRTRQVSQACEGAGVGLLAARRRAGLPEDLAGLRTWIETLKESAASLGEVHAAFAARAGREGFARLELYHARRAVRRGCLRSLPRVATALFAPRAHAGPWGERWTLALAGPLRLSGIKAR